MKDKTFSALEKHTLYLEEKKRVLFALPKAKYFTTVITARHMLYLKYVIPSWGLVGGRLCCKLILA